MKIPFHPFPGPSKQDAGELTEARVYDRALTENEIQILPLLPQPQHGKAEPQEPFEFYDHARTPAHDYVERIEAGVAVIPAYLRAGLHGLLKQHHPDENTEQIEARMRELVRIVLEAGR